MEGSHDQQQHQRRPPLFGSASSSAFENDNPSFGVAPFGQPQQQATTFGYGSSTIVSANSSTGFGSLAKPSSSFGSSASPFAIATAPVSFPFGTSASTINSNPFGSTFSSSSVGAPTFGTATGFGGTTNNIRQSSYGGSAGPALPNPFVSSSTTSNVKNPFAPYPTPSESPLQSSALSSFAGTATDSESNKNDRQWVRNSQNETTQSQEQINPTSKDSSSTAVATSASDELSRLKAKIEEKKRQLEEQKRSLLKQKVLEQKRKQQQQKKIGSDSGTALEQQQPQKKQPPQSSKHRETAVASRGDSSSAFRNYNDNVDNVVASSFCPAFVDTRMESDEKREKDVEVGKILSSEQQQPQMNENKGKTTSSNISQERPLFRFLPLDLQPIALHYKPPSMYDAVEDHHDASSSLVGICKTMCPTEELLRREYENDIPLLEIPHSSIHPMGWTLRETCMKRFRRSAADYKLDIPSLVRPPMVLERCVSYLEEFVMERDRQGIDPRFGKIPPSLDVYQFVWDRTRMIRKDFILQNYIGMSANNRGLCSAVAVRCHERIARWHVMMEHQLSHLPEYVAQQSVQNIQELGQTLKTLNQLYDDTLGRTTMPDEGETSSRHGCQFDFVQGPKPVDYDGVELNNSETSPSTRFVGTYTETENNGTAEAEMRGLYILLTMHNDGGMEVLKYAASLSIKNPFIFQSKPVQLALSVFRARKEWNYARFFQILRSSSTPYLFACIMFKYVEEMRKVAIYVMSRAYGTRRSKEGGGVYDRYKLSDLIRLLCFEDETEARNACEHFGITVIDDSLGAHNNVMDDDDTSTSGTDFDEILVESRNKVESFKKYRGPFIRWRDSRFREPIDPIKGCKIPLKTKKMMRTIESKLHGATRLAVCRGDVSKFLIAGNSIALSAANKKISQQSATITSSKPSALSYHSSAASIHEVYQNFPASKKQQLGFPGVQQIQETVGMGEGKMEKVKKISVQKQEGIKVDKEQTVSVSGTVNQQLELFPENVKKTEEKIIIQKQSTVEAVNHDTIENKVVEEERLKVNQYFIERVESERREEQAGDLLRRKREEEEERKRNEAAKKLIEKERFQREFQLQKQREEEKFIAEELHRQKVKAEEEKKRIQQESERIEKEWENKTAFARKCLACRLWLNALTKKEKMTWTTFIPSIDPTFCNTLNICRIENFVTRRQMHADSTASLESLFIRLAKMDTFCIDVAGILATRLRNSLANSTEKLDSLSIRPVVLFKVAVVFPRQHNSHRQNGLHSAILSWINSRVPFNELSSQIVDASFEVPGVVRFILVNGSDDENVFEGCDAAIFCITPCMQCPSSSSMFPYSSADVPCKIAFILTQLIEVDHSLSANVTNELGDVTIIKARLHPSYRHDMDLGLTACFEHLIDLFLEKLRKGYRFIERLSFTSFACQCIRAVLAGSGPVQNLDDSVPRVCLTTLISNLNTVAKSLRNDEYVWPAREFCIKREQDLADGWDQLIFVPGYFGIGIDLPYSWLSLVDADLLRKSPLSIFFNPLVKNLEDIIYVARIEEFNMPFDVTQDCELFLFKNDVRGFLENILICIENYNVKDDDFIYLPIEVVKQVFHLTVSISNKEMASLRGKPKGKNHFAGTSGYDITVENIHFTVDQVNGWQIQPVEPFFQLNGKASTLASRLTLCSQMPAENNISFGSVQEKEDTERYHKRQKIKASKKEMLSVCFTEEYEASKRFSADLERLYLSCLEKNYKGDFPSS